MSKHFLVYAKPSTINDLLNNNKSSDESFVHWASQQLSRVSIGDTLWIVSIYEGQLRLNGKIPVDRIMSDHEAVEYFRDDNIWEADYHVVCSPDHGEPLLDIPLDGMAEQLRFMSTGKDRLVLNEGRVDPQQLQTMRVLTPESAMLLQSKWDEALAQSDETLTQTNETLAQSNESENGAGFGNHDQNREVEKAAVDYVKSWYEDQGWTVKSVEQENRGYDLDCQKADQVAHVEVKGIRGAKPNFIITHNELEKARTDPCFFIAIITCAMSETPKWIQLNGGEFTATFAFKPLQFAASPILELVGPENC